MSRNIKQKRGETTNKILIVDDLIYNQEALKIFVDLSLGMGKAKNLCDCAKNGIEAIQLIVEDCRRVHCELGCSYSLIFMDGNMPRMNGYEATDHIRKYFHDIGSPCPPIVGVTGDVDEEYIKRAYKCGFSQVLSKPVKADILDAMLKNANFKQ